MYNLKSGMQSTLSSTSSCFPSLTGTDDAVESNGTSADGGPEADVVDFDEFYAWASATVPLLYLCFSGFIYSRICPSLPIPLALSFQLPSLREKSSIIERTDQLFNLALTNASVSAESYDGRCNMTS